jgi:Flp pilus assembly protein TadD
MPEMTIQQAFEWATRLAQSGRHAEAEQLFRQIIARQPASAEARYNLARVLAEKGDVEGAIAGYRGALGLEPVFPEALSNLGELLRRQGKAKEAVELLRRAIAVRPGFAEARYNLGLALSDDGQTQQAIDQMHEVLKLLPNSADAHNQLGNLLRERDRPAEAIDSYRRALALRPDFAEARWHLALALLLEGNFDEGWEAYEARRRIQGVWRDPGFSQPFWDGTGLEGRTILLWAEQGFGDTIQFIRYLPLVEAAGDRVIALCQPELRRLLARQDWIEQVLSFGEALPRFDFQCPLMSLPRLCRTTALTVPGSIPYLRADPELAAQWKSRMSPDRLNVGLVWSTRPAAPGSGQRSIGLHATAPLATVPGVRFWSLQKGDAASEMRAAPPGMDLVDCSDQLGDFADTAALIANLDLVIACDTAVAHLAGAMGVRTWIALPLPSPWRWMREREDSPWYPTVRLFRHDRAGDWTSPIDAIARELREFAGASTPRRDS